jgi:hypothetical protein
MSAQSPIQVLTRLNVAELDVAIDLEVYTCISSPPILFNLQVVHFMWKMWDGCWFAKISRPFTKPQILPQHPFNPLLLALTAFSCEGEEIAVWQEQQEIINLAAVRPLPRNFPGSQQQQRTGS